MSKIKILHVIQGFLKGNGVESFSVNLINNLDKEVFENFLIIPEVSIKDNTIDDIKNISFNEIIILKSLKEIPTIVKLKEINIIHIHYIGSTSWNRKGILYKDINGNEFYQVDDDKEVNIDNDPFGYVYISKFWNKFLNSDDDSFFLNPIINPKKPKIVITLHVDFKIPAHVSCDALVHISNKTFGKIKCLSDKSIIIPNGIDTNKFNSYE